MITENNGTTELATRKRYAGEAFDISSNYDTHIHRYFNPESEALKISERNVSTLRYGENPHQKGYFLGKLDDLFEKKNGKELSYNNLLDVDAAVALIADYEECTFVVMKHNNACGLASRPTVVEAFKDALAGDPVSAFGGILIANREIDAATATEIDKIFYEVVIAPSFSDDALAILSAKKNRIILVQKQVDVAPQMVRTALNGYLVQDRDVSTQVAADLKVVTKVAPSGDEVDDLLFANKLVKHTKSNTIVLVKNGQLLASGTGQTSRIDALKQAIVKAKSFDFDLQGAVMASDAFFPFGDSVQIANEAGIMAVIQPGGSIKDNESITYCDAHGMSMVMTGVRHFKH